jgi:hypothetical protein
VSQSSCHEMNKQQTSPTVSRQFERGGQRRRREGTWQIGIKKDHHHHLRDREAGETDHRSRGSVKPSISFHQRHKLSITQHHYHEHQQHELHSLLESNGRVGNSKTLQWQQRG